MIRYKLVRLCGTFVSAAVVFLVSSAWLAGGISAQTAESAIAGSTLRSAGPTPFLVAPSIPLGYAPSSVATGDLRHSGKLDLVTTDYTSGNITVFLGAGQGKFAAGVEYAAGPEPSSVLVADINGDGRPDVVVANQSAGTISVLLGKGDGTLEARQTYTVGFNPSFIATGDFGGNGRVDVAVAGSSRNLLAILLNDGNGSLEKAISRSLSKTPTSLAVADFNGGGHADVALANTDGSVSILLGKGEGLFSALADVSVASGSLSSIATGDFNKDGKTDLIVTQPGQKQVSVLLGKGDGTFDSPASYAVGHEPVSTVVADVNGDGISDLVVINNQSNTFSVLDGNGDGTFASSRDFIAGNAPLAAVAGDFYGSGHVDLAIINHSSQTVSIPGGNGDGTFKAARSFVSGQQPVSIASGNLNGGAKPGVVVANYCGSDLTCASAGNVAVFLPDTSGAYRLSSTYSVGAGPVSVALADVNGDKNLDIVVANRLDKTVTVMMGAGDGTFRQPATFPLAAAPLALAVGDFNKDGNPDLAVLEDCGASTCMEPGNVEILLGAGTGTFQSLMSYQAGFSPSSLAIGDINGDKKLDIVVANRCGAAASCLSAGSGTVLLGDGTGKFKAGTVLALGNSPSSIALGSLTGSGLDLIVARSTDNTVAVLKGNGDGTFKTAVPYAVGVKPGPLVVADFNGDGKADVAVTNFTDATVSVLYGNGDSTLQPATTLPTGTGPVAMTAIGGASGGRSGLATANGNTGADSPGTEFSMSPDSPGTTDFTAFTVASATSPSSVNEGVQLTASITTPTTTPPTATVAFSAAGAPLSDCSTVAVTTVTTTTYTATCTTFMLLAGTSEALTAAYAGDSTYAPNQITTNTLDQTVDPLSPTLTLSASPSSSTVDTPVTLSATFGGVTITPIGPTGTVSFTAGGNPIACSSPTTGSVDSTTGVATCATSALVYPADIIGASYTSDGNYNSAVASPITVSVGMDTAAMSFGSSPTTATVNQQVTFTVSVAPSQGSGIANEAIPGGSVTFRQGTLSTSPILCNAVTITGGNSATGTAGSASCTTAFSSAIPSPGVTITAYYSGDQNFSSGSQGLTPALVVSSTGTSTTVTSSPSASSTVNQAVTFTATVAPTSTGSANPTGSVSFSYSLNGGTSVALCGTSVAVSTTSGVTTAVCPTSLPSTGSYVVKAQYTTGDQNFGSSSGTEPLTVTKTSTGTAVSASPSTLTVNKSVTFTAIITPFIAPFTGSTNPGGTVAFSYSLNGGASVSLCASATVSTAGSGASAVTTATCATALPTAGSYAITASYSGDGNFSLSSGATNQAVGSTTTSTSVSGSPSNSSVNQQVTFTATVASTIAGATSPTGTVTFSYTSATVTIPVNLCSPAAVSTTAGVTTATCMAPLPATGSYTINATYSGDGNFGASSGTTPQTVGTTAATTVTVLSSAPTSTVNQNVTFTATVAPTVSGSGNPTGSVTFSYTLNGGASVTLCSAVTLGTASGVTSAPCASPLPTAGSYIIKAVYTGDANFGANSGTTPQTVNKTATTTTVSTSPTGSSVNQGVTFTATVASDVPGSTHPTGTVTFSYTLNGGASVNLCTAVSVNTVSSITTATCLMPLPSTGSYTITAAYAGDGNFTAGSGTAPQTVSKASTTTTVSASPSTLTVNKPVTFTATITPSIAPFTGATNASGTVAFSYSLNGGASVSLCASATVSTAGSGASAVTTATCAAALPTAGSYVVTASYSGDGNFSLSSGAANQAVGSTATSTTVSGSPANSAVNQQVTFTATVAPTVTGATSPTGTVTFSYTSATVTVPVNLCAPEAVSTTAGVSTATCLASLPATGSYTINAAYSGDNNFGASSGTTPQTVGTLAATTVTVLSSAPSSAVNQSVIFTATVAPTVSGSANPTGSVTFSYTLNGGASVTLCNAVNLSTASGVTSASCTSPLPTAGSYTIKAVYTGDANFGANSGTTPQTVNKTATTTTVNASPTGSSVDQPVTFTATVTSNVPGSTTPTGTVTFSYTLNGGASVGLCSTVNVSTTSGVTTAICLSPLPSAGAYSIVAAYIGDGNFVGGSGTAPQTVSKATTTTTVSVSPSPSAVNQAALFTATVIPAFAGTTNPTGTVAFSYSISGGLPIILCAALPVSTTGGVTTATCLSPLPSAGSYTITAVYSGDGNFPASSGTTPQTVNKTSTSAALSALPLSPAVNQTVTFTALITSAISGSTIPTGTVTFSYTLNGGASVSLCTAVNVTTGVSGTTANCAASLPSSGNYNVTAAYSGNPNFASSSVVLIEPVGLTSTTTSVSGPTSTVSVNQTETYTATIKPALSGTVNPSGTVTFSYSFSGGPSVALCTAANVVTAAGVTTAVCMAPLPSKGSYIIAAAYSGDPNYGASSGTLSQIVGGLAATSVTLQTPTPTTTVNQAATFTAIVAPVGSSTLNPTGTVTFRYSLNGAPSVALSCVQPVNVTATAPITASCVAPLPLTGSYTITAAYSGDSNFATSSGTTAQTVNPTTTTTALSQSLPASEVNQPVTFTATVASTIAGSTPPTGKVTFYSLNGATSVALCTSVNVSTAGTVTTATCAAPFPTAGSYTITAVYSGDGNFLTSPTPGTVAQTVIKATTSTTVSASPSPSAVNQNVTFIATITPAFAGVTNPSGTVAFSYNGPSSGTLSCSPAPVITTVTGTTAVTTSTCIAPLPATGSYTVTATYSGDGNFQAIPGTVAQTVKAQTIGVTVTSTPSSPVVNQAVTFTATVAPSLSGATSPTGTVTFTDNTTGLPPLCTAMPLSGETALCTFTMVTAGKHVIVAQFNTGNTNYPSTPSLPFTETIGQGATTVSVASLSPANTSVATQSVKFTATVTPAATGPAATGQAVPTGSVVFSSTDGTLNATAVCKAAPIIAINGTGSATCGVAFPASIALSLSSETITAQYEGDPNFLTNSGTTVQTVQNFSIANAVTATGSSTSTAGPVILSQCYSFTSTGACSSSNLKDPFNPVSVALVVTSSGMFSDTLSPVTCLVTNSSNATVSDPSCTLAASTMPGATGTQLAYTLSTSATTPVGAYTVALTATDKSTATLIQSAPPLIVYVLGVANTLSLAQGASGQENVTFNTASVLSSDTIKSIACGKVVSIVNGVQGTPFTSSGVTCTSQIPAAGISITSKGTTTVAVSISTSGTKSAELRRSNTVSLAALLGIPLLALMGWVGSRKSPRRNFFRFIGLILLLVGVSYASGCGGSFTSTSTSTSTGIAAGNYLVQVVATDPSGNNYYAVIPLDVSPN